MAPRKKKPSKASREATEALFRPLAFPTRAAWDAELERRARQREAEQVELRELGVDRAGVEQITGELSAGMEQQQGSGENE